MVSSDLLLHIKMQHYVQHVNFINGVVLQHTLERIFLCCLNNFLLLSKMLHYTQHMNFSKRVIQLHCAFSVCLGDVFCDFCFLSAADQNTSIYIKIGISSSVIYQYGTFERMLWCQIILCFTQHMIFINGVVLCFSGFIGH